jgi:1,4-alpha-glucan branching enzyme
MINLNEVGAEPSQDAAGNWQVHLGIYLPGITFNKGYRLSVRIIHEADQFIRGIEPKDFWMSWVNGSALDLWQATIPLVVDPASHFGQDGRYLYRYQLQRADGSEVAFWFADPFGFDAGIGTLSAFTKNAPPFAWTDAAFRPPEVDEMVVYELNVREFNRDFQGVVDQLDYLHDLGVNTIELMPVTNVKEDVEWGYTPLNFYSPDDRLGGRDGLKQLVNACHRKGIAVIADAVYAHAHPEFAYNLVYETSGEPNPMMGYFAGEFFSRPGTDYSKGFTRDFFFQLNRYWLREYHVDGFRYDYVPGFYDGPAGVGYANLVFNTYQDSKTLPKFQGPNNRSLIIQCAENLPDPQGIVSQTYSNCTWQNALLDEADGMARGGYATERLAHRLDPEFSGYPSEYRNPPASDAFPVAPFQYFESHDHRRFINEFGEVGLRDLLGEAYGDRGRFFKVQPFIIALYTGKGIPMLWNGQEFGENWGLPNSGIGRNLFERPLHWEYFYDRAGKSLVRLCRILGTLRRNHRALRSRGFFFYYFDQAHLAKRVLAYRRRADAVGGQPDEDLLVVLNFSDSDAEVWLQFPVPGQWGEQIDGTRPPVQIRQNNQWSSVIVPSNYGCVYKRQ